MKSEKKNGIRAAREAAAKSETAEVSLLSPGASTATAIEQEDYKAIKEELPEEAVATNRPLWETDPRFLDPFKELPPVRTWALMGIRPAFPKEGLIVINAKPKNGKSLCSYAIMAPLLSGRPFDSITPLERPESVIIFDLEMNRSSILPRYRAIRNTIGAEAGRLLIVPMLGVSMRDRWAMIEEITSMYNPAIIVIDHAGKTVRDFNSQEEAATATEHLSKLKESRTVIAIIHQNKNDENMKGALGSSLDAEQCEVYKAVKDGGIFTMTPQEARDSEVEGAASFSFVIEETDHTITAFIDPTEKRQAAREKEAAEIREYLDDVFGITKTLSRKTIMERIAEKSEKKETWVSAYFSRAVELGVIVKTDSSKFSPYQLR